MSHNHVRRITAYYDPGQGTDAWPAGWCWGCEYPAAPNDNHSGPLNVADDASDDELRDSVAEIIGCDPGDVRLAD